MAEQLNPAAQPVSNAEVQTFDQAIKAVLGADGSDQTNSQGILFRHRLQVGERTEVMRRVFLSSNPHWRSAFLVMILLSGAIATLGLSQNSAATIIGSMIVAPLGGVIVALGGAIAVVWPREIAKMFATIVIGSAIVVLVAYLMGLMLPISTPNAEILGRTSPDLRDLGVALLAGAAGAYAQTRKDLSATLVGVAIAVALVPPLATAGLMLEEQRWTLAAGALTLFGANLVGIAFAVTFVLLVTRYAPLPRLRPASAGLYAGLAAMAVATILIAIPLTITYLNVAGAARTATAVHRQVAATVGPTSSVVVERVDIDGSHVTIKLSDKTKAPDAAKFAADLTDELGPDVTVELK